MRTETIRWLDYYVGISGCYALTLLRKGAALLGWRENADAPVERILFIKLVEQGATTLAYGAIKAACEKVGPENVYFCVFRENREILDIIGIIPPDNVWEIRTDNTVTCLGDLLRTMLRARRLRVDSIVDMEFFSRGSAMLAFLCGAQRRVGIDRLTSEAPFRGGLMTHRMQYNPYVHVAAAYRLLVDALDRDPGIVPQAKLNIADFPPVRPRFSPNKEERQRILEWLGQAEAQHAGRPIIVLNPNDGDSLGVRKWPLDRYTELGRRLLRRYPTATLVVVGTPSEEASAGELVAGIGSERALSLAGKTTLRDLVVLLALADVLVTNDCGPAHFACMTDIDVVVLFGPETPLLFAPLGEGVHIIHHQLGCSPCLTVFNHRLSPCNDNVCIKGITVDEVLDRVTQAIARRQTASLLESDPSRQ